MQTPRRVLVFGPAYLDRVLLVDRPLVDPNVGGVIDRSVTGRLLPREARGELALRFKSGIDLIVSPLPSDWPGPVGTIDSGDDEIRGSAARRVHALSWHDDLGGMGAGFARALGGELIWPSGDAGDEIARAVSDLLRREGIAHRPAHAPGIPGDWTLVVTSGPFGDKLAVGFRSPSDGEMPAPVVSTAPFDLIVAASMNNRRAAASLRGTEARVKLFAPSIRNMLDREPSVGRFAREIDVLCCNRHEWESLEDREEVAWRVSILAVTDGPRGATIRFTDETGEPGSVIVPPFPRLRPPRDTNRAGEAFASALVSALLDLGWTPGVAPLPMVEHAAERASAAAALVLDRADFGFPSADEVDRAIERGVVDGSDRGLSPTS